MPLQQCKAKDASSVPFDNIQGPTRGEEQPNVCKLDIQQDHGWQVLTY